MRSRRYPTMVLLALLTLVPASAAAQEASAASHPRASHPVAPLAEAVPVATEWRLIEQRVGDVLEPVPVTVPASLRLADGAAVGNSGCNEFSGSYTLDGSALSFGDEVTRSLRACDPERSPSRMPTSPRSAMSPPGRSSAARSSCGTSSASPSSSSSSRTLP